MPGGERARRRVVAHGNVQGVFFRDTLRKVAEGHGVAGWVRNRADGSVEACLEGREHDVEQVVAWCADGPDKARVTRLDEIEEEPQGLAGFRVK